MSTDTRFKKGHPGMGGRPKKLQTQVKDFIKEHPYAVETLMKVLYEMGIEGDREAAIYIIDRIKGKPKATLGIAGEDKALLTAATVLAFRKLMDKGEPDLLIEPIELLESPDEEQGEDESE